MPFQVVLQRGGQDLQTLYWKGSLGETQKLARAIALELDADLFRIIDLDGCGVEVYSEHHPFEDPGIQPLKGG